jgi:hypothetical protein
MILLGKLTRNPAENPKRIRFGAEISAQKSVCMLQNRDE